MAGRQIQDVRKRLVRQPVPWVSDVRPGCEVQPRDIGAVWRQEDQLRQPRVRNVECLDRAIEVVGDTESGQAGKCDSSLALARRRLRPREVLVRHRRINVFLGRLAMNNPVRADLGAARGGAHRGVARDGAAALEGPQMAASVRRACARLVHAPTRRAMANIWRNSKVAEPDSGSKWGYQRKTRRS